MRQGGGGGTSIDVGFAAVDGVERRQPLGDQVLVGRKAVVGQGLPVRQQVAQAGCDPGDVVLQTLSVERVGCDHHQHAAVAGERAMAGRLRRAGERLEFEPAAGLGQFIRGEPKDRRRGKGHRGFSRRVVCGATSAPWREANFSMAAK